MNKLLFLTLLCFCLSMAAYAQSAQPPATLDQGNYPYLVLSQVSGVAATTTLSEAQKVSLAEFFKQEEASITDAVNSDMAAAALEQLKGQLIAKFQSILTTQQLAEYSTKRPGSYLAKAAAVMRN